jgi:RimJ/RimL family protein N-acetyltransferase
MLKTPGLKWKIREATEADIPAMLDLCQRLSVYEKLEFKGTPERYRKYGFGEDKIFDCLLVENAGESGPEFLGIALYYFTFSTFEAKPTLWLEDIFVPRECRGNGIGTQLLKQLCHIATEKDCGRVEWTVLDWNEQSRQFYFSLGAKAMDEWTTFRMTTEAFEELSENFINVSENQ